MKREIRFETRYDKKTDALCGCFVDENEQILIKSLSKEGSILMANSLFPQNFSFFPIIRKSTLGKGIKYEDLLSWIKFLASDTSKYNDLDMLTERVMETLKPMPSKNEFEHAVFIRTEEDDYIVHSSFMCKIILDFLQRTAEKYYKKIIEHDTLNEILLLPEKLRENDVHTLIARAIDEIIDERCQPKNTLLQVQISKN